MERKEYVKPSCQVIELNAKNTILQGSNEGGSGNENYASRRSMFEDFGESEVLNDLFVN